MKTDRPAARLIAALVVIGVVAGSVLSAAPPGVVAQDDGGVETPTPSNDGDTPDPYDCSDFDSREEVNAVFDPDDDESNLDDDGDGIACEDAFPTATPSDTATATTTATTAPTEEASETETETTSAAPSVEESASPASSSEIDSCVRIDEPGRYVLTADIEDSTDDQCIQVLARDVVLDGAGHSIDGVDDFPTSGIVAFGRSGATNVTVTNVTVSDWGAGIVYEAASGAIHDSVVTSNSRGFAFTFGAGGIHVADNTITENDQGIYLQSSSGNVITNNTASGNDQAYYSDSDPQEGPSVNNTVGNLELDSATVSFESKDVVVRAVDSMPADPEDRTNIGQYVDASANSPDSFLDLSVSYEEDDLGEVDESTLALWRYDGAWSTVPGSTVDSGANVVSANITAFANGSVFAPLGKIGDGGEKAQSASVTFENQTTDGTTVTVESVTMSEGGFVAIHNASLFNDNVLGSVIGVSEKLSAGTHENVEVTLFDVPGQGFAEDTTLEESGTLIAMPHFDSNENGVYDFITSGGEADGPYTTNGSAVVDTASITVGEEPDAEATYYQVDFVRGEPIESLDWPDGTYTNDQLIRFAHGSTDEAITRRSEGEFTTDAALAERIDSQEIAVENGTATITFTVADGESVTLSLASYTKPDPIWDPEDEDDQVFVDAQTDTYESGTHTLTVDLPDAGAADGDETDEAADEDGSDATDDGANSTENATTLSVLSYNDIQTAAAKDGNFSRLITLIEQRRQAHDNPTVVVGGGDQIAPHALGPVSQWRAPVDVLNLVDPAADTIGNHDLDYGLAAFANASDASEFPWLATNLENASTGEPIDGAERYEIVERDGVRIGLIGLADAAIRNKTNIEFGENATRLTDFREVGPETAAMLKAEENVDTVIALAHIGVPEAKELARADDGAIDAIAVGDDEIYYPPQETSGTVITEAQARAEHLGELNLTIENGEVVEWDGRIINVTDEIPKNETASGIINEYRSAELPGTNASFDEVIVRSESPLDARFASNFAGETGYGNLITDAMRAETGADVAITNAGGIRSDRVYGPGNITAGDVYNTLPFANTLVTVEVTGTELQSVLASQIGSGEVGSQVSGITFDWTDDAEGADTVRNVTVGGEALDEDATYTLTVNSFIAQGGDNYPLADKPRVSETDTLLATTVIEYMQARETVAPAPEGRIERIGSDAANDSENAAAIEMPNGIQAATI
ncbi:5'-nucleotidase C-terminal domain-containing protein [Halococcus agarilyticus]|uniref:5'-nucleotidase C-terminal domain-containing protein n=1 Tax=Halococcus agarilyticus TaxID=1232219 RepID=UPI00067803C1|nr:5'-nucleotidase C-terminal domain-containing protein [Halococcus agarilyticus]